MKATLKFNLPDEDAEFFDALNGSAWRSVVIELDNDIRNIVKHGDPEKTGLDVSTLHWVRHRLQVLLADRDLDVFDARPATASRRVYIDTQAVTAEEAVEALGDKLNSDVLSNNA